MKLHLMGHPQDLAIVRLDPDTTPDWDFRVGPFATIAWTDTETSVVTLAAAVPPGLRTDAHISVLAMSTFDTDWILVQSHELEAAAQAWRRGGLIYTATTLFGSTA